MKKALIILSVFFILTANGLFMVNSVFADNGGVFEGVSSCMNSGNCSLCGFLSIFVNIGRWILSVMGGIALVYFVWAGISFIMSFGNSEKVANAKKMVIGSILGIGIIFGAWTLVNFIFVSFVADDIKGVASVWNGQAPWSTVGGMCENLEPTIVNAPVIDISTANNEEARLIALFLSYGIKTNNPPCSPKKTSKCTNLAGMKPVAVQGTIDLAQKIGSKNVVISGGTEPGHSSKHTEKGIAADFWKNSAIKKYVADNTEKHYFRTDGTRVDVFANGDEYAEESDHWDVCFKCKG